MANPLGDDLSQVFKDDSLVEIFEAWTLGSLFGYESTFLNEGNSSVADYVYLLKPPSQQDGTTADYKPYFHDGVTWKEVGGSGSDASETVIYPDESFMIARRGNTPLDIVLSGTVLTQNTFFKIPQQGKRLLMNNPFGVDIMLSDLISSENIDDNVSNGKKWLSAASQEVADNVEILDQGVWHTYWHDGTNKDVSSKARISARAGTGVAGSITQQDLSMNSKQITAMSNPTAGSNVVVTSPGHGLRSGFVVRISGARGRKTNDAKNQVNEDGNVTAPGAGLIIESAANGFYEITNVTIDTFELLGKSGNCDFISEYCEVVDRQSRQRIFEGCVCSFVGGGGQGANWYCEGSEWFGYHYHNQPRFGSSKLPKSRFIQGVAGWGLEELLMISTCGQVLLVRKHPSGVFSNLAIRNQVAR